MAPTEIRSEAPTDEKNGSWEEMQGRTGGERTVSQSHCHFGHFQSCSPWQACLSSDTGRSCSMTRQEGTMLWLTFSKHRLHGRTEKELQWGKGTGPLWEKGGRWGGRLGEIGEAFWFWWHYDYCCVTGGLSTTHFKNHDSFFFFF